jgi:uncharacterized protein (TIRG00374 family)
VLLLLLAVRRIDLHRVIAELHSVRALWIFAAIGCYLAILPLWALQWRLLAPYTERNRFRRMLAVVAVTSSTYNTTALLVGEATAAVLLVTQIGLSRSAALSVIAMDQLVVGIAKLGVLMTAAFTLTLPGWMAGGVTALGMGVALLLVACVVSAWHYEAMATRVAPHIPARVVIAIEGIGQALAPLRSARRSSGALLLALLKKFVEILAIVCVQHAFGVDLPFASAVLVLAALNLVTLVPIVPGNLGVYEGAVVLTYAHFGMPTEQAIGIAVVQHASYFVALALPGYAWVAGAGVSRSAAAAS